MHYKDIIETNEYKECLDSVHQEEPFIFVSGKAGVGKSVLVDYLQQKLKGQNIAVVAPTGVAAINVGGQTIHSFFGFPPETLTQDKIIPKKGKARKVMDKLDLLIIDEISMVRADIMDGIDTALKKNRGSEELFGGVQILSIGDLFQLSPVVRDEEMPFFEQNYDTEYFFSAHCLKDRPYKSIMLEHVFRQKDEDFIHILNSIRNNDNHRDSVAQINRNCYGVNQEYKDIERDVTLTARNKQADTINKQNLSKLEGEPKSFQARISGNFRTRMVTPEILDVKKGAQVMFTKNKDDKWVNGSLGTVVNVGNNAIQVRLKDNNKVVDVKRETWEVKKFDYNPGKNKVESNTVGEFEQFPLTLAWALTIHKSQGITLDSLKIDLGDGAFAPGQTYVALSRCTTLEGISLDAPLSMKDVKMDNRVVDFYKRIEQQREVDKQIQFQNDNNPDQQVQEKQSHRKKSRP